MLRSALRFHCPIIGLSALLGVALSSVGCARSAREPLIGSTDAREQPVPASGPQKPRRAPPAEPRMTVPDDAVERAALPYHGFRAGAGEQLAAAELMDQLASADAICIGEQHPNPHDHFAQLAILRELASRARMSGRELGLGLEMFDRGQQSLLASYASARIDEAELLRDSEWADRWGYPFPLYRPMLELARHDGLPLIALNAPRELSRKVARGGLGGLSEEEKTQLPELDQSDKDHRRRFDAVMKEHPHGHGKPENMYLAQLLWDETMADLAAAWLAERSPARQIVILAGRGHCTDSAIPARIRRRGPARAVSVLPVHTRPDAELKSELSGFDYGLVFEVKDEAVHASTSPTEDGRDEDLRQDLHRGRVGPGVEHR